MRINLKIVSKLLIGYQPYIFSFLAVVALVLGFYGFSTPPPPDGPYGFWDALYNTLALAVVVWEPGIYEKTPWTLNIARFLAPTLTGYALFRGTMFLLAGAHETMRRRRIKKHIIVCGLGKRGRFLAISRSKENAVVAIDSDPTPEVVTACANNEISLVGGNASDPSVLLEAGIGRASEVFIFTGNDNKNLEIIHAVRKIRTDPENGEHLYPLECYLSIKDLYLRDLIPVHEKFLDDAGNMQITPFNDHKNVARNLWSLMLDKAKANGLCLPLPPDHSQRAHLLLIGYNPVGQAIAMEFGQQGHFANGKKSRMTIVDENLGDPDNSKAENIFSTPLKRLARTLDLELIRSVPDSEIVRNVIMAAASDSESLTSIVSCGKDDTESLTLALHINDLLRQTGHKNVPVFVRLTDSVGLSEFLAHENNHDEVLVNVFGFGLFEQTFSVESIHSLTLNRIAMAIHAHYQDDGHSHSDQEALRSWNKLPEYLKEANRVAAEHLRLKLATVLAAEGEAATDLEQLFEKHIDSLSKMEHNRWMAEKVLQGWTYGEVTNKQTFTHKNIVGWDALTEEEKEKDRTQVRATPKLLRAADENS